MSNKNDTMTQQRAPQKIYLRDKTGRQVEVRPGYWARRVWVDYFKKVALVAVLGGIAGGLVAFLY